MTKKLSEKELNTLFNTPTDEKPLISNDNMLKIYKMYAAICGDYADEAEIEETFESRTTKRK